MTAPDIHMFTPSQNESREASGNYILAVIKIYYKFNKQMT
jgi:hypothetical protein